MRRHLALAYVLTALRRSRRRAVTTLGVVVFIAAVGEGCGGGGSGTPVARTADASVVDSAPNDGTVSTNSSSPLPDGASSDSGESRDTSTMDAPLAEAEAETSADAGEAGADAAADVAMPDASVSDTGTADATPTDTGGASGDAGGIVSPAFYVATNGNDANPGTLAQPFASLAKAQSAMQASTTIKTTYIRAGTYTPPMKGGNCVWGNAAGSSIGLSSLDDGETWSYFPPDGYGSAVLDGQSTVGNSGGDGGNGVGCAFGASQVSNVTVVGLAFQSYLYSAFWAYAATNAVFEDNVVTGTMAAGFGVGAVILTASPGAVVENNYIHDVAYMGISIADNSADGGSMSNTTVAGNVVIDSCTWPAVSGGGNDQNGGDCGAIYFWSQKTSTSMNMQITNNYVRDVNKSSSGAGDFGACCGLGIYLDDGMNNVTETGNVVTGVTTSCFMIHGGDDNVIRGNLCDIGSSGAESIVTYQNDSMTQMLGNVFENNIVVAGSTAGGDGFWGLSPPNPMTIDDNLYFNYVGATVDSTSTGGAGSDSAPTYANPDVSCWAPRIGGASPALASPVVFPGLQGGWGPPAFVIPMTGTPPSWPHGC